MCSTENNLNNPYITDEGVIAPFEKMAYVVDSEVGGLAEEQFPLCPWCGAPLSIITRQTNRGWRSQCCCKICEAKAPAVYMEKEEEELVDAARLVVSCRFIRAGGQTNGDKIRMCGSLADSELAEVLWKVPGLVEMMPFCRELPECQELAEGIEPIPESKCKQCLSDWLGQPAKDELCAD